MSIYSLEDFRKLLNCQFDPQGKWFYFETEKLISGSVGRVFHWQPLLAGSLSPLEDTQEATQYMQTRIVAKIQNVFRSVC